MTSELFFIIGFVMGCFVTYNILNVQLREYRKLLQDILTILEKQVEPSDIDG